MAQIRIDGVQFSFERLQEAEEARERPEAMSARGAAAPRVRHYLVQTRRPLDQKTVDRLRELKVVIVEEFSTLPDEGGRDAGKEAYVWLIPAGREGAVRAIEIVEGMVLFPGQVKLSPTLFGRNPGADGIDDEVLESPRAALGTKPAPPLEIRIELHADFDIEDVLPPILAVTGADEGAVKMTRRETYTVPPGIKRVRPGSLKLKASPSQFRAISEIPGVRRVTAAGRPKLANNVARRLLRVPGAAGVPTPPDYMFAGEDEVIAVADTGFDRGAISEGLNPPFAPDRIVAIQALGRIPPDDPNGHGTHVAGSIIGHEPDIEADPDWPNGVSGVATKARLVIQALFLNNYDPLFGIEGKDLDTDLFEPPYKDHGARVHTNSWGSEERIGTYDERARQVDTAVRAHRDLVILFAAGNSGEVDENKEIAENSIWAPGTAKNCITVGASESERTFPALLWGDKRWDDGKFSDLPTASEPVAGNPEAMAPFSSRGPVEGGRIKPDLVAPGTSILSTRSWISAKEGWGTSRTFPESYLYLGGTSMATPLVAGCAAIVREFLKKRREIAAPGAALVKAALINGAKPITGAYSGVKNGVGQIPNNHQGFGRVDVAAAIGLDGSEVTFFDESTALSSFTHPDVPTAAAWTTRVTVGPGKGLKVTLAWTDEPSERLVSDLDLIVIASDGTERHGNMGDDTTSFDSTNNVEQVTWEDIPAGEATIMVRATKVREPQVFALVHRVKPREELDLPVSAAPADRRRPN